MGDNKKRRTLASFYWTRCTSATLNQRRRRAGRGCLADPTGEEMRERPGALTTGNLPEGEEITSGTSGYPTGARPGR